MSPGGVGGDATPDAHATLAAYGPVTSLRFLREKGLMFVEMSSVEVAQRVVDASPINISGFPSIVTFVREGKSKATSALDWICSGCTFRNYSRRSQCFTCGRHRDGSEATVGESSRCPCGFAPPCLTCRAGQGCTRKRPAHRPRG